jgi:HSP20 family protein
MFWTQLSRPRLLLRDMERLHDEMHRLFPGFDRPLAAPDYPALNVWTNEDGARITAELPGVVQEDIDIAVRGRTFSVSGVRKEENGGSYHRRERLTGSFTRTLDLPFQVDADRVEATVANGILTVELPRAEADKPRKIAVKAG